MWNDLHGILNENYHAGIRIMCNHLYASIFLMLTYEYIFLFMLKMHGTSLEGYRVIGNNCCLLEDVKFLGPGMRGRFKFHHIYYFIPFDSCNMWYYPCKMLF